jgi:pullulanase
MMRTKRGEHNTYNLPDEINQIDWHWKTEHKAVFEYYKKLIHLRKAHPAFRMSTSQMLNKHLKFVATETGLIGYQLKDNANGDWLVAAEGESMLLNGGKPAKDYIAIPPVSMLICEFQNYLAAF